MRIFKDDNGRAWTIKVTTATLARVHGLTGYWLTDLVDPKSEVNKAALLNPTIIPNLVYAAVKPQADEAGVSDEQFAELMLGDVLGEANEKLVESVIDFFQSSQQRETNRALLTKSKAAATLMLTKAAAVVDTLTPEMIAEMVQNAPSGTSALISPASSE